MGEVNSIKDDEFESVVSDDTAETIRVSDGEGSNNGTEDGVC